MNSSDTGQLIRSAAQIYDDFFVPALFGQWPSRVLDAAGVRAGQRVLDVACGTGVLACAARERVGARGAVAAVDVNQGMLGIAARKPHAIDWRLARAEALPFDDGGFDAVLCQFGLMFFADRAAAIREMLRVCRPGGSVAVAVWSGLDSVPGYAAVTALLARLFGDAVADALRVPFALGDVEALRCVFEQAGAADCRITTIAGTARFPSVGAWMHTDVRGWTLANVLDDDQFQTLQREAAGALRRFADRDGVVSFSAPAHVAVAQRSP